MKNAAVILATGGLIFAAASWGQAAVTFEFDPVDFFAYKPAGSFSQDGGMFGLHKIWGVTNPGVNDFGSWNSGVERTMVDNFVAGLGSGEGIAGFNIWLLDEANARAWGEKAVWNPIGSAPTGSAPAGWSVKVGPGPAGGYLVGWSTTDPNRYIRPGNGGTFSFSGTAYWDNNANGYDASDPEVVVGEHATIWFGGYNWSVQGDPEHFKALVFDKFTGGFGSQFLSNDFGTGFEATLRLQAIPEPASSTIWFLIGALGFGFAWWRRIEVGTRSRHLISKAVR